MAMLEIHEISKTHAAGKVSEVKALRSVSLAIEPGSFVVVIGTNGSGKSTLLNAVAGSVTVDSGRILIAGQDVTKWAEHRRARFVGRVFQNPFTGTCPKMSIAENLVLAARRGRRRGLGWALSKKALAEVVERIQGLNMGLENRLDTLMQTLSGGQRQALTLLMATWLKPDLLLLDEHTAALDPKSAEQVIQLTRKVVEREKMTTLMVTHSMHQAASLGDRLLMMHKGEIIHDAAGAEKQRLRPESLIGLFEEVRRSDQLDVTAAEMLRRTYV